MEFAYTRHWKGKKRRHPTVTPDQIEYALIYSKTIKDKRWDDLFNAIWPVPPTGRVLKVVYRRIGKHRFEIITAYWMT